MSPQEGVATRRAAVDLLVRIERDGAYANLLLADAAELKPMSQRDRAFTTELVYGATRMRRACDWLVERFLTRDDLDDPVRAALRIGAYQLVFLDTPPHAAVSTTVESAPKRARGLVNAVLRRVADAGRPGDGDWPSPAVRLSYPDWIVELLQHEFGDRGLEALERMNQAPPVTRRADGYVQDEASQWVAAEVGAGPGERVADLCAAPGGKATALAATGAFVLAGDRQAGRLGLVANNARRLGSKGLVLFRGDACHPPLAPASIDRVLVDAPCSGLGVLRRRPDARWRITPDAVARLADLQREMIAAAARIVRPGGTLHYSVCTLSAAETVEVAGWAVPNLAGFDAMPPPGAPWSPRGDGAQLLPQDADTDGMFLLGLRRRTAIT